TGVGGGRTAGSRARRRRDRARRAPTHAHAARRRRGAGETEGSLEAAPAALLTRLRPAVPRSRAAGQRGMRFRLPARPDARALRGQRRSQPRVAATPGRARSRNATALPGRDERWGLGGHLGAHARARDRGTPRLCRGVTVWGAISGPM